MSSGKSNDVLTAKISDVFKAINALETKVTALTGRFDQLVDVLCGLIQENKSDLGRLENLIQTSLCQVPANIQPIESISLLSTAVATELPNETRSKLPKHLSTKNNNQSTERIDLNESKSYDSIKVNCQSTERMEPGKESKKTLRHSEKSKERVSENSIPISKLASCAESVKKRKTTAGDSSDELEKDLQAAKLIKINPDTSSSNSSEIFLEDADRLFNQAVQVPAQYFHFLSASSFVYTISNA